MVCYFPRQASFFMRDGKKVLDFRMNVPASREPISLPCGNCIGCRLEKSRQWAVRCMHEASLYEDNSFVTLTYSHDNLPKDGSLDKRHFQLFMKRLRLEFPNVRYYMCGEYGEKNDRPHYHAILFNIDFTDKVFWKSVNDQRLYTSEILERIWGMGFCPIGSVTFESAAYVARYCTKKVNGKLAEDHYQGRLPEYNSMSLKPGIGYRWYAKWKIDCFPSDYLVVNGSKCKPPRYYDKQLEKEDPLLFEKIKQSRVDAAKDNDDNTYDRLLVREKCQQARFKKLIRTIERSSV